MGVSSLVDWTYFERSIPETTTNPFAGLEVLDSGGCIFKEARAAAFLEVWLEAEDEDSAGVEGRV
jgi:hypothetical protein